MGDCADCIEVRKIQFQIKDLELVNDKQDLDIEEVRRMQETRDLEHETMIQGLTTRMDNLTTELGDFKTSMNTKFEKLDESVSKRLDKIEASIPEMFTTAANALLAKIAKWLLISMAILIAIIILAVTRPILLKSIDEIRDKVEKVEVTK